MNSDSFAQLAAAQRYLDIVENDTRRAFSTMASWHGRTTSDHECRRDRHVSAHVVYLGEWSSVVRNSSPCVVRVRFLQNRVRIELGRHHVNPPKYNAAKFWAQVALRDEELRMLVVNGPIMRTEHEHPLSELYYTWGMIDPSELSSELCDFLQPHVEMIWRMLSGAHPELLFDREQVIARAERFGFAREE